MFQFRGITDLTIAFNSNITDLLGENGTGKTTVLDAIHWVMTGKDSTGATKFDLMPLDDNNNLIPNMTPTVVLKLTIDGMAVELKREMNKSTQCYVNGIPMKVKDYNSYISSNLLDEKMFMTMISPTFFGDRYKWSEQRDIIQNNLSIEDTAIDSPKYADIKDELVLFGVAKLLEKYNKIKKDTTSTITKLSGTREYISSELDGKCVEIDSEVLITRRLELENIIATYESSLTNMVAVNSEYVKINKEITSLEVNYKLKVEAIINESNVMKTRKKSLADDYKKLTCTLNGITNTCPTCGTTLEQDRIDEQKSMIQTDIDNVIKEGKLIGCKLTDLSSQLEELNKINVVSDEIMNRHKELKLKLESTSRDSKSDKVSKYRDELKQINDTLSDFDSIVKLNSQLKSTKQDIKTSTTRLDDAEATLALIKGYNQAYSQLMADNINSKLDKIQIKTFNVQQNGDLKDTFEITMGGVPYSSLNSAGKIIAGVELITLLRDTLNIDFPIVIDNKESITSDFDVCNQIITLSVSKGSELSCTGSMF